MSSPRRSISPSVNASRVAPGGKGDSHWKVGGGPDTNREADVALDEIASVSREQQRWEMAGVGDGDLMASQVDEDA
jgi:hypothetical protein